MGSKAKTVFIILETHRVLWRAAENSAKLFHGFLQQAEVNDEGPPQPLV